MAMEIDVNDVTFQLASLSRSLRECGDPRCMSVQQGSNEGLAGFAPYLRKQALIAELLFADFET